MIHSRTESQLAFAAFSRGWLRLEALWSIAEAYGRSAGSLSTDALFAPHLTAEQLRVLSTQQEEQSTIVTGYEVSQTTPLKLRQSASPMSPQPDSPPASGTSRYQLGDSLGAGGSGVVFSAVDNAFQRRVALKVLRRAASQDDPLLRQRFIREATITAQLEHPGVIPIYDLGAFPDGRSFYTMRIVKSRSLREVLQERTDIVASLPRLCGLFVQVCRAIAYAHSKHVIHRDLKPENILLGDYGEVYVADWGVCKLMTEAEEEIVSPPLPEGESPTETQQGSLVGTVGYMSPEQVLGDRGKIDTRADLFSLGVILYEILTNQQPFVGESMITVMMATLHTAPRPPRLIVKGCPLLLEELCLALLQTDPNHRPQSASVVTEEIELYLTGAKERARRTEEAASLARRAAEPIARYLAVEAERQQLLSRSRALLQRLTTYESIEKKRPAWALEDLAEEKGREQARSAAAAIVLYSQALGYDPALPAARRGLADLYWGLAQQAEARHDEPTRLLHESRVLEYDDGYYSAIFDANAWLSLRASSLAEVFAYPYVERDRALVLGEPVYLGQTPLRNVELTPGSYLLLLRSPGVRDTRYPVKLKRGEHHQNYVNLYAEEALGADFIYVPGGSFVLGGDLEAFDPLPRQEVTLVDFAIGRFPVTFSEYLQFLDDLPEEEAHLRKPQALNSPPMVEQGRDGRWFVCYEVLVEGVGRRFCTKEEAGRLPVLSIRWFDAVAYCNWRSAREGVLYRLPTEAEWEKSARGVDGRFFPWGDRFDSIFCKMRDARPGAPQPEPIGAFPLDESPYGVRDLAGGIRDLCADMHGVLDRQAALLEPESTDGFRVSRGGAWNTHILRCHAAARFTHLPQERHINGGLRLVRPLQQGGL